MYHGLVLSLKEVYSAVRCSQSPRMLVGTCTIYWFNLTCLLKIISKYKLRLEFYMSSSVSRTKGKHSLFFYFSRSSRFSTISVKGVRFGAGYRVCSRNLLLM